MEEKVIDAMDYLCNAINLTMVLSDSLKLSFENNGANDYQYTVAESILDELNKVLAELNAMDCEICALKERQV